MCFISSLKQSRSSRTMQISFLSSKPRSRTDFEQATKSSKNSAACLFYWRWLSLMVTLVWAELHWARLVLRWVTIRRYRERFSPQTNRAGLEIPLRWCTCKLCGVMNDALQRQQLYLLVYTAAHCSCLWLAISCMFLITHGREWSILRWCAVKQLLTYSLILGVQSQGLCFVDEYICKPRSELNFWEQTVHAANCVLLASRLGCNALWHGKLYSKEDFSARLHCTTSASLFACEQRVLTWILSWLHSEWLWCINI